LAKCIVLDSSDWPPGFMKLSENGAALARTGVQHKESHHWVGEYCEVESLYQNLCVRVQYASHKWMTSLSWSELLRYNLVFIRLMYWLGMDGLLEQSSVLNTVLFSLSSPVTSMVTCCLQMW
jgi:hypothetical protein